MIVTVFYLLVSHPKDYSLTLFSCKWATTFLFHHWNGAFLLLLKPYELVSDTSCVLVTTNKSAAFEVIPTLPRLYVLFFDRAVFSYDKIRILSLLPRSFLLVISLLPSSITPVWHVANARHGTTRWIDGHGPCEL